MRFSINREHVISESVDGESTLVHVETTYYYGLNTTGTFIWNFLTERDATFEEILDAVSTEYEVERDVIRGDVEQLLKELKQEELIIER